MMYNETGIKSKTRILRP